MKAFKLGRKDKLYLENEDYNWFTKMPGTHEDQHNPNESGSEG